MKNVLIISIIFCFFMPQFGQAQINILNRAKQRLEDRVKTQISKKIDEKIDEKIDQVTDKIVDKVVESAVGGASGGSKQISDEKYNDEKYNAVVYTPAKDVGYDFGVTLNTDKVHKFKLDTALCLLEDEYEFPLPSKTEWSEIENIRAEKIRLEDEIKTEPSATKTKRIVEIDARLTELRNKYPPKATGKRTISLQFKDKDSLFTLPLFAYFNGQTGQQKTIMPSSLHLFEWFNKDNNGCSELNPLTDQLGGFLKKKLKFCCEYKGSRLFITNITKVNADHYAISGAFELDFDCPSSKYNFTKGVFKDVIVEDANYDKAIHGVALIRQRFIKLGAMGGILTLW